MMKIISRARGHGKTYEAIRAAAETHAYLVVADKREAQRVAEQADKMGLRILFPITFDEFLRDRLSGSWVKKVVIDNADMLLQRLAPVTIEAVTLPPTTDS